MVHPAFAIQVVSVVFCVVVDVVALSLRQQGMNECSVFVSAMMTHNERNGQMKVGCSRQNPQT